MNGTNGDNQGLIEIPAEAIVNHLANRVAQLTIELEMARATIAYLTSQDVSVPPSQPVSAPPSE